MVVRLAFVLVFAAAIPTLVSAQARLPENCGMTEAEADYGALAVGSEVTLQRHRFVGVDDNWDPRMVRWLGRAARVTAFAGVDARGCPGVRVDADGGQWFWRVRDLGLGTSLHEPPSSEGHALAVGSAIPQACHQDEQNPNYGSVAVGTIVTLSRHRPVDGEDNWADEMTRFVGRRARVTELSGLDSTGCPGARVDADGGQWFWRIRDFRVAGSEQSGGVARGVVRDHGRSSSAAVASTGGEPPAGLFGNGAPLPPQDCGLTDAQIAWGPIRVGAEVILGQHRDVNGDTNWSPEMQALVGTRARITELIGVDDQGCAVVHVDADRGQWFWRVRDMQVP